MAEGNSFLELEHTRGRRKEDDRKSSPEPQQPCMIVSPRSPVDEKALIRSDGRPLDDLEDDN